jgi:hypothetical protein
MEVLADSYGKFHIKLHIRNRADNFIWTLVAVYGAAQEDFKAAFLREMVNLAKDNPYPILVGGDFNMLRSHLRRAEAGLTTIGLFYSTQSLTAWI